MEGLRQIARSSLPAEVHIEDEDVVRVVLEYLQRRGYISAMRALETESNAQAEDLGDDAAFLRALVLDGRWEDAITLIEPLRPGTTVHNRACFEIQKQAFLEQLENKGDGDNATALVKALHKLELGSSREEFNDLCYCLTLPNVRSHPDYASWTPHLGRLWCFEALRGYLGLIFPGQETPTESVPEGQLELLCQQACMYQAEQRRQEDPHAVFSSSVVGGILSDVWAPKDPHGSGLETSELSTASSTPGNSDRGPGMSPLTSAVRRHRRAGGEGGGRGAAVSRSQPLGWVLSCVSGEQLDGSSADREPTRSHQQPEGTLRASRARHKRSSTVGRDRDMPGFRNPLDLKGGGMHSVPVTPSGSLLTPSSRFAGPPGDHPAVSAATTISNFFTGATPATTPGGGRSRGYIAAAAAAAAAARMLDGGSGHKAVGLRAGIDGSSDARSSAEMLIAAAAQVPLTSTPPQVAGRGGTPLPRGGGDADEGKRGFDGGGVADAPPPNLEQLTPRWSPHSRLSSFSSSDGSDSGSESSGGEDKEDEEDDYVFLRGKAASAAVAALRRPSMSRSGSGLFSTNQNAIGSSRRREEEEMAVLMSNSVRDLDAATNNNSNTDINNSNNSNSSNLGTSAGTRKLPPVANASNGGGSSSSSSSSTASTPAADANDNDSKKEGTAVDPNGGNNEGDSNGDAGTAPVYTADAGAKNSSQAKPAATTSPLEKRPVCWEIRLTSPSSANAVVYREGTGGVQTGGSGSGSGRSNGTVPEEPAASSPPVAGNGTGARQGRQEEGAGGQQWRPPPAKEEGRRAGVGAGEASRIPRSDSRSPPKQQPEGGLLVTGADSPEQGGQGAGDHENGQCDDRQLSPGRESLRSPEGTSTQGRKESPECGRVTSEDDGRGSSSAADVGSGAGESAAPGANTVGGTAEGVTAPVGSVTAGSDRTGGASSGSAANAAEGVEKANGVAATEATGAGATAAPAQKEEEEEEEEEEKEERVDSLKRSAPPPVVGGSRSRTSPTDDAGAAGVADGGGGDGGWGEERQSYGEGAEDGVDGHGFEFDRLSREEAPGFVPTVVVSGSHPVRSVGFSVDGELFAAGSNDRTLRVCKTPSEADLASNTNMTNSESGLQVWSSEEILRRENLHRGSIYCLAFSPDSSLLATGSNDKAVRLLKLPGATARAAAEENENAYLNGKTLGNGNGHAYNGVSTGDNGGGDIALRGHTGTVRDVCFPSLFPSVGTPAGDVGRLLSVGAGDFACRVWDVEGGVMSGGGGPDDGMEPVATFRGHTDTVFSCSMLPGGNVAVTGGADSFVRVWDTRTGETVRSLVVEGKEVLCVRPWPGDPERLISTAHSDGYVFLWDMRTGRALSSVLHHTDQTRSLDFSQDGSSLLTASYDGLVGVCDCRPRGPSCSAMATTSTATTDSTSSGTRSLLSSGDGGGRGSGAEDPEVDVTMLSMLRAHGGRVLQGKWKPSGGGGVFGSGRRRGNVRFSRPAFLTSSTDCTVMLWSLPGGTATAGARAG